MSNLLNLAWLIPVFPFLAFVAIEMEEKIQTMDEVVIIARNKQETINKTQVHFIKSLQVNHSKIEI